MVIEVVSRGADCIAEVSREAGVIKELSRRDIDIIAEVSRRVIDIIAEVSRRDMDIIAELSRRAWDISGGRILVVSCNSGSKLPRGPEGVWVLG